MRYLLAPLAVVLGLLSVPGTANAEETATTSYTSVPIAVGDTGSIDADADGNGFWSVNPDRNDDNIVALGYMSINNGVPTWQPKGTFEGIEGNWVSVEGLGNHALIVIRKTYGAQVQTTAAPGLTHQFTPGYEPDTIVTTSLGSNVAIALGDTGANGVYTLYQSTDSGLTFDAGQAVPAANYSPLSHQLAYTSLGLVSSWNSGAGTTVHMWDNRDNTFTTRTLGTDTYTSSVSANGESLVWATRPSVAEQKLYTTSGENFFNKDLDTNTLIAQATQYTITSSGLTSDQRRMISASIIGDKAIVNPSIDPESSIIALNGTSGVSIPAKTINGTGSLATAILPDTTPIKISDGTSGASPVTNFVYLTDAQQGQFIANSNDARFDEPTATLTSWVAKEPVCLLNKQNQTPAADPRAQANTGSAFTDTFSDPVATCGVVKSTLEDGSWQLTMRAQTYAGETVETNIGFIIGDGEEPQPQDIAIKEKRYELIYTNTATFGLTSVADSFVVWEAYTLDNQNSLGSRIKEQTLSGYDQFTLSDLTAGTKVCVRAKKENTDTWTGFVCRTVAKDDRAWKNPQGYKIPFNGMWQNTLTGADRGIFTGAARSGNDTLNVRFKKNNTQGKVTVLIGNKRIKTLTIPSGQGVWNKSIALPAKPGKVKLRVLNRSGKVFLDAATLHTDGTP